eukprot:5358250-Pyramimonas_sp.AAC.1
MSKPKSKTSAEDNEKDDGAGDYSRGAEKGTLFVGEGLRVFHGKSKFHVWRRGASFLRWGFLGQRPD